MCGSGRVYKGLLLLGLLRANTLEFSSPVRHSKAPPSPGHDKTLSRCHTEAGKLPSPEMFLDDSIAYFHHLSQVYLSHGAWTCLLQSLSKSRFGESINWHSGASLLWPARRSREKEIGSGSRIAAQEKVRTKSCIYGAVWLPDLY